jgi:hypothetical protein
MDNKQVLAVQSPSRDLGADDAADLGGHQVRQRSEVDASWVEATGDGAFEDGTRVMLRPGADVRGPVVADPLPVVGVAQPFARQVARPVTVLRRAGADGVSAAFAGVRHHHPEVGVLFARLDFRRE